MKLRRGKTRSCTELQSCGIFRPAIPELPSLNSYQYGHSLELHFNAAASPIKSRLFTVLISEEPLIRPVRQPPPVSYPLLSFCFSFHPYLRHKLPASRRLKIPALRVSRRIRFSRSCAIFISCWPIRLLHSVLRKRPHRRPSHRRESSTSPDSRCWDGKMRRSP